MSLTIARTTDRSLTSSAVLDALRAGIASTGRAILLVPTYAAALDVERALASNKEFSLGVTTTTPVAFAKERWEVWGDGCCEVSGTQRTALMTVLLDEHDPAAEPEFLGGVPHTEGTIRSLCRLAAEALPHLPLRSGRLDGADPRVGRLTQAERDALSVVSAYASELRAHKLIEQAEIMYRLPELLRSSGAPCPAVVVAGFDTLPLMTRDLVAGLAAMSNTTFIPHTASGAAGNLAKTAALRLAEAAREAGVEVSETTCTPSPAPADGMPQRTCELAALSRALYAAESCAVEPSGATCVLRAAGPMAEPELVARYIAELPSQAREVAVVVADADRAWRELAPKLASRGCLVRSVRRRTARDLPCARAFLGLAGSVARLLEVAESWSSDEASLPDMSWWPPRALTDFLLSEISFVEEDRAWKLDASFRSNRSLTPEDVLSKLRQETSTSRACAQATGELCRGRIGQAALALTRAARTSEDPCDVALSREALATLSAIRGIVADIDGVGIRVTEDLTPVEEASKRHITLMRMVRLLAQELESTNYIERLELGEAKAPRVVRILTRQEASALAEGSVDALVCCSMTTAEWPLTPQEGAVERIYEHLELALDDDELDHARATFSAIVAAPRSHLALEHAAHDADSAVSYPSVTLSELLACYGIGDVEAYEEAGPDTREGVPELLGMGEEQVSRELSATGSTPAASGEVELPPTGHISAASREVVVLPRDGGDGTIALSATQIESYLECPYKWFTLRRLGLSCSDAEFGALQFGNVVHRTLEVTYSELIEKAAQAAGLVVEGDTLDQEALAALSLPGVAPREENLAEATALLKRNFASVLEEQRRAIVPHTTSENYRLERLEPQLAALLEFESTRLRGFEPRYTEWSFGGEADAGRRVSYAGVDIIGTADRIDIDSRGRAIIIDYKHKSAYNFEEEYDVFRNDACTIGADGLLVLPRRVQSLIYAQVVRRMIPDVDVRGAIYLSTSGVRPLDHAIAGVLDDSVAEAALGSVSDTRRASVAASFEGNMPIAELLDRAEEAIAAKVERLMAGEIEANPTDARACAWCPAAATCERRLA